jgi:hypothetical protein
MVRKVFFSFDFDRDIWRVNQVRNSNLTKEVAGFIDPVGWESVKKGGDPAIQKWIDQNMIGTTVTAVLIGAMTSNSRWVRYEIQKTRNNGNGLLGIQIHMLQNQRNETDYPGDTAFLSGYDIYNWRNDDGFHNIDQWIERAASKAGR